MSDAPRPPALPRPSPPPAPVPPVVQAIDHLGEIAGIVCVTVLACNGRLGGELAACAILAILGVQTGLRTVARRATGGTGAVGLALLAAGPAVVQGLRVLGVAAVLLLAATACGPVRGAVLAVTPGVPPASGCAPTGASRCTGAVPEVCSASGRWWSALPPPGTCPAGCVVDDAGARCAAGDGGTDDREVEP